MQPLSDANFKKGFNRIYDWNLARSLNRIYSKVGLTFVWSQFVEIWSYPASWLVELTPARSRWVGLASV